jgi:hypothetical protein
METSINIDRRTGALSIGNGVRLEPFQSRADVEAQVGNWANGSLNHGNGYEWLYLRGLSFGGEPAALALCFHEGRLEQAQWSVMLSQASGEGGWPSREAIDEEVSFVRSILAKDGMKLRGGERNFNWGAMWSDFDPKGFLASNGLRYRRS